MKIQFFRTDESGQTVQTQIRLLLKWQSNQGLHCLLVYIHLLDTLLHKKTHCGYSKFCVAEKNWILRILSYVHGSFDILFSFGPLRKMMWFSERRNNIEAHTMRWRKQTYDKQTNMQTNEQTYGQTTAHLHLPHSKHAHMLEYALKKSKHIYIHVWNTTGLLPTYRTDANLVFSISFLTRTIHQYKIAQKRGECYVVKKKKRHKI